MSTAFVNVQTRLPEAGGGGHNTSHDKTIPGRDAGEHAQGGALRALRPGERARLRDRARAPRHRGHRALILEPAPRPG